MRIAEFITSCMESILMEWEAFARGIAVDAEMDSLALRDHAKEILLATVQDMNSSQSAAQRTARSRGKGQAEEFDIALNGASELHAIGRLGCGFDLMEVISEYRALRASVLRLWHDSEPAADERNVNDLSRFNESLDQSVAKAVSSYTQRVDQARDMFLAILSHDLRNPLNSIAMSAQLLPQMSHLDPDSLEYAAQISTNAQVMGRMISDLLDYTRTRLGVGMPVTPEPMDLERLAGTLINEYRTAHPTRELQFHAGGGGSSRQLGFGSPPASYLQPPGQFHPAWGCCRARAVDA